MLSHQPSIYRFRGGGLRGSWFLKLWEVGALLGLWQGQMGSVMGHSHHRRPPPVEIVWRNKVEDAPPQNCFDLGLGSYLTPNCGSFPIPSPCTQIIPRGSPARHPHCNAFFQVVRSHHSKGRSPQSGVKPVHKFRLFNIWRWCRWCGW